MIFDESSGDKIGFLTSYVFWEGKYRSFLILYTTTSLKCCFDSFSNRTIRTVWSFSANTPTRSIYTTQNLSWKKPYSLNMLSMWYIWARCIDLDNITLSINKYHSIRSDIKNSSKCAISCLESFFYNSRLLSYDLTILRRTNNNIDVFWYFLYLKRNSSWWRIVITNKSFLICIEHDTDGSRNTFKKFFRYLFIWLKKLFSMMIKWAYLISSL